VTLDFSRGGPVTTDFAVRADASGGMGGMRM
jgi:hypothetical protein